jgi:hypothetical protein
MGWTKRQFLEAAYEEIGLAGYIFDLSPEQLQTAVRKMDSMVASWNALGIRIGYPVASNPASIDIDQETGVPDSANEAIYCGLAMRLAGGLGKQVTAQTAATAHNGYTAMLTRAVQAIPVQMPRTMPSGQGNNRYLQGRVFVNPPSESIDTGLDGQIDDIEV